MSKLESEKENDRPVFRNQKILEEEYSYNKLASDNPLKSAVNYGIKYYKPDRYHYFIFLIKILMKKSSTHLNLLKIFQIQLIFYHPV